MRNTIVPTVLAIALLTACGGKPKASIAPAVAPSPSPTEAAIPNIGAIRDGADGTSEIFVVCSSVTEEDLKAGIELYQDAICTGKEFVGDVVMRGGGANANKTRILLRGQQDWKNDSAIVGQVYFRHSPKWTKTGLKN